MKNTEIKDRKRILSLVYITVIALCAIAVIAIIFVAAFKINENNALKQREEQVIQRYEELAKETEDIKDENYAKVYFDGEHMYIPAKDIIIEYKP